MKGIGIDKVLHFLLGAVITFCVGNVAALQEGAAGKEVLACTAIGIAATMALELVKEHVMDSKADWEDVLATFLGALLALAANGIGVAFYYLSL